MFLREETDPLLLILNRRVEHSQFRVGVPLWEAHRGVPSEVRPLFLSSPELTQAPDIWVKEPLESGCLSHLTCSVLGACDGVLAPTISWTGPALKPSGLGLEAYNSSEILLIPRPQDHGTNLTCRVTFKAGMSTQSTITLNISCECGARTRFPGGGGRQGGSGGLQGGHRTCLFQFPFLCLLGVGGMGRVDSDSIPHCVSVADAPQNLGISISRENCTGRSRCPLPEAGMGALPGRAEPGARSQARRARVIHRESRAGRRSHPFTVTDDFCLLFIICNDR